METLSRKPLKKKGLSDELLIELRNKLLDRANETEGWYFLRRDVKEIFNQCMLTHNKEHLIQGEISALDKAVCLDDPTILTKNDKVNFFQFTKCPKILRFMAYSHEELDQIFTDCIYPLSDVLLQYFKEIGYVNAKVLASSINGIKYLEGKGISPNLEFSNTLVYEYLCSTGKITSEEYESHKNKHSITAKYYSPETAMRLFGECGYTKLVIRTARKLIANPIF